MKEILQAEKRSYDYVELHGYHAALILHFEKNAVYSDHIDHIRTIARKIIDCVQAYLAITIRIGIGRFYRKLVQSIGFVGRGFSAAGSRCQSASINRCV